MTRILADNQISIEAMIQKQKKDDSGRADIVLLTHRCIEGNVNKALAMIEALQAVSRPVIRIRVEDLS